MISNNLFKEVMHFKFSNVKLIGTTNNRLEYKFHDLNLMQNEYIPVAEFVFMCKKWAFDKGYELMSGLYSNDHNAKGKCLVFKSEDDNERVIKIFNADNEYNTIFDACQWILDNKDKQ